MVSRSQNLKVGGIHLRLPTPEDLIIMKAVANRPQDLVDIQAIAVSHPDLDKGRVKFWVEEFGAALDLPHLWEKISQLL
jgi:predicted nucleotidyltransferase